MKQNLVDNKELLLTYVLLLLTATLSLTDTPAYLVAFPLAGAVLSIHLSNKKLLKRASTNRTKTIYTLTTKIVELTSLLVLSVYSTNIHEVGYILIASYALLETLRSTLRIKMQIIPKTIINYNERTLIVGLTLFSSYLNSYLLFYGSLLYIIIVATEIIRLCYTNIYKR